MTVRGRKRATQKEGYTGREIHRKRDTQTDRQTDRHREIDLLGGRVGTGQGGRRMF